METVKAKDYTAKSDLEYYAIPDMEARIEQLKWGQEIDEKASPRERQDRVPQTEIKTDSESSEVFELYG